MKNDTWQTILYRICPHGVALPKMNMRSMLGGRWGG